MIYNYIPSFLSCRYHNLNDHFGYIHVPTNVTGLISLEGDNTVAPITIVPRTVRAFKNKSHSNSYQINKIMGNFQGMDSMMLMTNYDSSKKRSDMSYLRDKLAIQYRIEYRNFISDKKYTNSYELYNLLDKDKITNGNLEEMVKKSLSGATYLPIED